MNNSTKLLLGLAAGIAVTTVAALLIAPDEVKKYRKKAYKKGKKLWKETKETADEVVKKSTDISANIKDTVANIKDEVVKEGKELLS